MAVPAGTDPSGLRPGTKVIVTADDTRRDPVRGTLLAADAQELVIQSAHPQVGEINVHFPRAGFDVVPADDFEQSTQSVAPGSQW